MHRSVVRSRLAVAATFLLGGLLAGCDVESTLPDEAEVNFVGTWGGDPWEGRARATIAPGGAAGDTLALSGTARDPYSAWGQTFVTVRVPIAGPGTYPIPAGAARVWYIIGGDAVAAVFESLPSSSPVLVVTGRTGDVVTGRVTFEARTGHPDAPHAPQARFDAEFEAAIEEP